MWVPRMWLGATSRVAATALDALKSFYLCGFSFHGSSTLSSASRNFVSSAMSLSSPRRRLLQSCACSLPSVSILPNAANRFLNSHFPPPPIPLPPPPRLPQSPPASNRHNGLSSKSPETPQKTQNPRPFLPRVPQSTRSRKSQGRTGARQAPQGRQSSTRLYLWSFTYDHWSTRWRDRHHPRREDHGSGARPDARSEGQVAEEDGDTGDQGKRAV